MRILAIERELPTPGYLNLREILRDEAASVWALMKGGLIRDIWFTAADRAVIMLECAGAAEARRQLATLPLVQRGLIEFTVLELHTYDGLDRLLVGSAPIRTKVEEPPEY